MNIRKTHNYDSLIEETSTFLNVDGEYRAMYVQCLGNYATQHEIDHKERFDRWSLRALIGASMVGAALSASVISVSLGDAISSLH